MQSAKHAQGRRQNDHRIAAVAALLVSGCSLFYPKSAPAPGPLPPSAVAAAEARWPDATESSLVSGRQLFVTRCNECHDHPDVRAVSEAEWPEIIDRMGDKADLNTAQKRSVLYFVLTARAQGAR